MGIDVEHFDLTGRNALVLSAETPAGQAIAEAYAEAGARVIRLNTPERRRRRQGDETCRGGHGRLADPRQRSRPLPGQTSHGHHA